MGIIIAPKAKLYPGKDAYTKLLLHMDGADGGTVFKDECGHAVTASGATTVTGIKKFGISSAFFGASKRLSLADSDDWYFGGGDFTVDFWAYFTSFTNNCGFFEQYDGADYNYQHCMFYSSTDNVIYWQYVYGGVAVANYTTAALSLVLNKWYHIAVVRKGSNIYIFINGISQTLTVTKAVGSSALENMSKPLYIGCYGGNMNYMKGNIDEFRISKGIARWTVNFIPPICPYY